MLLFFTGSLVGFIGTFVCIETTDQQLLQLTGIEFIWHPKNIILQKKAPNLWALIALSAGICGLIIYIWKNKESGYGFLLGLAGLTSLILLQTSFSQDIYTSLSRKTNIQFQWGYWSCAISFILSGSKSFISQTNRSIIGDQQEGKLYINIISSPTKKEDGETII